MNVHTLDLNFLQQPYGIASYLVELPEGPVLIETGPHSTLSVLEAGLSHHGYRMKDIRHVFVTHIHLDHAGAAWCFAEQGAQVYLHPFGFNHMNDPSKLLASAKMIYKDKMEFLWGTLKPIPEALLTTVDHGGEVKIGNSVIKAWHSPGHAKHHIAWQIDDTLFTGDVAGISINGGPVIPPCPPPDINIEDWYCSLDLIADLRVSKFYLTHFGEISNTDRHIDDLRSALHKYAEFIKPYWEKGIELQSIVPKFREFSNQYLIANGMSLEDAPVYEVANPADMSVAGLMRYWSKRKRS